MFGQRCLICKRVQKFKIERESTQNMLRASWKWRSFSRSKLNCAIFDKDIGWGFLRPKKLYTTIGYLLWMTNTRWTISSGTLYFGEWESTEDETKETGIKLQFLKWLHNAVFLQKVMLFYSLWSIRLHQEKKYSSKTCLYKKILEAIDCDK